MSVFRNFVVVGTMGAIAFGNMPKAISASPSINSGGDFPKNNYPHSTFIDRKTTEASIITAQVSVEKADNPEFSSTPESKSPGELAECTRNLLEILRSKSSSSSSTCPPEAQNSTETSQSDSNADSADSFESNSPTQTLEIITSVANLPGMRTVRELAQPETKTSELTDNNINLAQGSSSTVNPTENFPPAVPNGNLQTNPPAIVEPSSNPLEFPTTPDAVQIEETVPITLQQAVDIARRNNPTLQVAKLEVDRSQALLKEAQAALLPNLTFQSQLQRNISPQGELQLRANRRVAEVNGTEILDAQNINFGTQTFNNTFELNYDTGIDGARSARIRAAEEQVSLRQLEFERVTEDLRLQVTSAYYNLQEADGRVRVGEAAVDNAQKSLEDAEALERAGVGTRFDVLQAQVTLANEQQSLTNSLRDQRVSRRRLVEQLNVNESIELLAADPIEPAGFWRLSLDETIIAAFQNRAELEQQLVQRDLSVEQKQIALSQIRPSLSLFARYSVLGFNTDDSDWRAVRGWADGYTLGATMTWNLYDGGVARARAKQNQVEIAIAENRFAELINQVRREVEEGFLELEASFENISTAELGLEQAREALRLARLRFQAGVGTQLEVINSQTDLTRAQINLLVAIVNYNRALSELQRAVSNLPGNDLSDTP